MQGNDDAQNDTTCTISGEVLDANVVPDPATPVDAYVPADVPDLVSHAVHAPVSSNDVLDLTQFTDAYAQSEYNTNNKNSELIFPMAVMHRSMAILLSLISLLALCSLLPSALAIASGSTDGYTINGRVKIPGFSLKGSGLAAKASNVKVILNSGQRVTFLRPDGYFSLYPSYMSMHFSALISERSLLLFLLFH
ncbi:hypothetical protein K7X08_032318 [Anisodus acutangulus]|uniref:Uncharacterized protein n=1 Tax=Anisodus acutangulus TaxID=402998 RepID=A0A9Q1LLI5_9SOLA|nr:hypothetical protein K7X08_032318 [Anisodus acutangulus]